MEFEIDDVIEKYRGDAKTAEAGESVLSIRTRYERCCREFSIFHKMELLRLEWGDTLQAVWEDLYAGGLDNYKKICHQFDDFLKEIPERKKLQQQVGEQLMLFFIHTYFCGAVYDAEIAVKVRLAVFSVRWIQELVMHRWLEKNSLSMEDVIEMSWRYAREVEHSDVNLEILEEALLG